MRCIAESAPSPYSRLPSRATPADPALREFQVRDIPRLADIVAEALHERYEPSLYATLSQQWPEGFLVAAEASDRPVGFLLGVSQVESEGRVLMFAVDQGWRTRGIGTRLMQEFLQRARARGLRRVTLEVRVSNATAIRFYTRFRFSVVDRLPAYYSDGENGYQMAREVG